MEVEKKRKKNEKGKKEKERKEKKKKEIRRCFYKYKNSCLWLI